MAESTITPEDTEFSQRILTISTVQFLIQIRDCDVKQTILYLRCTVWISKRRQMVEKGYLDNVGDSSGKSNLKSYPPYCSAGGESKLWFSWIFLLHMQQNSIFFFFKLRDLQPSKKAFHTHKGNPSFCHIGGRIVLENRFHAKNIISCDIPK